MDRTLATDRRSGDERRRKNRNRVAVDIEWETTFGRRTGTLSDINELGCFVLTGGFVENDESVRIHLPLDRDIEVELPGRVVNYVHEIGFACDFVDLTDSQRGFLNKFAGIHNAD